MLTITMLVSDREDTIEKCMKSLVHLREAVPSELIVVDTAENKVCMDIVRQYTENIVRFEWCNDFAAARNAGVKKAKGEWLMFLDDDEWFETTKELEDFFLSGKYKEYNAASYVVRNYHNYEGTSWSDFEAVRLAKREKNSAFEGKIHEYLTPLRLPFCYLGDYVHHYGYVFNTPQERNEHAWRNIRLLLEMRKAVPENVHVIAQLIQEYVSANEAFSAIELCKELRRVPGCWQNISESRYATYSVMMETRLYFRQQRYAEGYHFGKEILALPDITVLAKGILHYQMIHFCYYLGKYDEAIEYIEKYKKSYDEWLDYPDKKILDAFSECATFMEEDELIRFALLRLHIHVLQEEWKKITEDILAIDWKSEGQKILPETPTDIISALKHIPFDAKYLVALECLLRPLRFRTDIYKATDQSSTTEKSSLLSYFSTLPPMDSKMCLYHLIYAGEKDDFGLAVPALEKMRECNFPFFLPDKKYWDSLLKLNIQVNSYLDSLSAYEWMEMAKRLWAEVDLETCESAYLCLIRGLEKTELRFLFLSALMMEKRLLSDPALQEDETSGLGEADLQADRKGNKTEGKVEDSDNAIGTQWVLPDNVDTDADTESGQTTDEGDSPRFMWQFLTTEELWDRLNQLSQYWVSCAASLYREDVFMGKQIEAIPPAYRFGWYIMQANAVRKENTRLFVNKVAEAAKAYPVMKELCKQVIKGETI